MGVPLLDLSAQHQPIREQIDHAIAQVIDANGYILGPRVEAFEAELAAYCGVKHAVGVASGTDALLVSMMAMGIGPGDEVITTPFTFFSTAGSIVRLGAKPVFVDIDPRTFNIEPGAIEGAITPATKAIMPVHLFGLAADMDPIMAIARRFGLRVIEDAAQAIGAACKGRRVGSIGDVGCLSFYPSKNLAGIGDGGAVVTDNDDLAARILQLRNHGLEPGTGCSYTMVGGNFRLDGLQAAVLSVKLPLLESYTEARRANAARYTRKFEEARLSTPSEPSDFRHVFNQYTIRVRDDGREPLRHHLSACGVGNRIYYETPLHLQPCFRHLGYKAGSLPEAEKAADQVLSIPCYPELSREQQDAVITAVRDFFVGD